MARNKLWNQVYDGYRASRFRYNGSSSARNKHRAPRNQAGAAPRASTTRNQAGNGPYKLRNQAGGTSKLGDHCCPMARNRTAASRTKLRSRNTIRSR